MKSFDVYLNGRFYDTLVFGSRKSVGQVMKTSTVTRLASRGKVRVTPTEA